MNWTRVITSSGFAVALRACSTLSPQPALDTSSVEAISDTLSEAQAAAPQRQAATGTIDAPLVDVEKEPPVEAERFDINVRNVAAREFYSGLVAGTDFNMVVHPKVAGKISLKLGAVTLDEVMQILSDVYGYGYKKSGNLYQVLPNGLRTEVFQIDYLNIRRQGISETQVSAGRVSDANTGGGNNSGSSGQSNNGSDSGNKGQVVGTKNQHSGGRRFLARAGRHAAPDCRQGERTQRAGDAAGRPYRRQSAAGKNRGCEGLFDARGNYYASSGHHRSEDFGS